jgi:hypothetical protein
MIFHKALQNYNIFFVYANFSIILLKKTKMYTSVTSLLYKMWVVVKIIVF